MDGVLYIGAEPERQPQCPRLARVRRRAELEPELVRQPVESELRLRRRSQLASFLSR